jgi:peptide chain release factor 1
MNPEQIQKWQTEFDTIDVELSSPNIYQDPEKLTTLSKRHTFLKECLLLASKILETERQLAENEEMLQDPTLSEDMVTMIQEEQQNLTQNLKTVKNDFEEFLNPKQEQPKEILIEIRSGAGGDEASLFAGELFKAYTNFLVNHHQKVNILDSSINSLGGIKEVIMEAKGENVFDLMQFESGVHRVQRIPSTEKSGRIHTSTISVAVLPIAKEVELEINPNDLKIDVFRSSGPGGQSVNTTDSAIRITHLPSGLVVSCQDEKSQHKNKDKALKILRSRLLAQIKEDEMAKASSDRKEQIGTADRSEKIRTYNFPQDRVTDHRIHQNFSNIEDIMLGNFDKIVKAFHEYQREHKSDLLNS